MNKYGITKIIISGICCLILWFSYFISPVYANESETVFRETFKETTEKSTEETIAETVAETFIETIEESMNETIGEAESEWQSFEDTKGKKQLSEKDIKEVIGYYCNFLKYDDVVCLADAGYDVSDFTEASFLEEIESLPMVFSMAKDHDTTYVGQAAVSFSKADADKLYLYGSNSYYKNGTYTRIYATKKRMTIGSSVYIGFCFEPSGTDPLADTVLDCYRLNNCPEIVKALYYGYSGPGFETGGFKTLLDGISASNSYFYSGGRENCYEVLTHCLIGKLYGDAAWAMGLSQESANAVVKMETMLHSLDGPVDPKIVLERHDGKKIENETTYIENNYQRTTTLIVNGDRRNSVKLKLPAGIEAVDGGGKVYTGTFSLNGGTAFYLRASLNYNSTYKSGAVKGEHSISYVPYMIFGGEGTRQDCGALFMEPYNGTTSMSVVFKASTGTLTLKKESSDPTLAQKNSVYSDLTAKFEVYNASGSRIGTIITNKQGSGTLTNIPYGTYTLKEVEAPKGYDLDKKVYTFTISSKENNIKKTIINYPKYVNIYLTKEISAEDIHFDHGNPMFIFKVTGIDREGDAKEMYRIVDFTPSYVREHTDSQGKVRMTVAFENLLIGEYTAKEMETSRYKLFEIKEIKNGILENNQVVFSLDADQANEGRAVFGNKKYEQQNYSDTSKVINELTME